MPITFAHPAAILPFLGLRRDAAWGSGLLAGSLMPDLLRPFSFLGRGTTHSLLGLLCVDTPAALLFAWILHTFLHPRIRRLPGLEGRGRPGAEPSRFLATTALVACLLGGLTHLGWDLFTHDQSPLTRGGILDRILFMTPAGPFVLGQTLWYVNSGLGMVAITGWIVAQVARSGRGVASFLSWTWFRILVVPTLPLFGVLLGFHRTSGNLPKDLFLHVFFSPESSASRFLVSSIALLGAMIVWETRLDPAARTSPPPP